MYNTVVSHGVGMSRQHLHVPVYERGEKRGNEGRRENKMRVSLVLVLNRLGSYLTDSKYVLYFVYKYNTIVYIDKIDNRYDHKLCVYV